MTTNGYPLNQTSFELQATSSSTRFYTLSVIIGKAYPYVLVDWVECTVLYFIPSVLQKNRYHSNSGSVTLKGFGGLR